MNALGSSLSGDDMVCRYDVKTAGLTTLVIIIVPLSLRDICIAEQFKNMLLACSHSMVILKAILMEISWRHSIAVKTQ